MVSSNMRMESITPLSGLTLGTSKSASSTSSFAQQLATALEGYLNQSGNGSQLDIKVSEVAGQKSGGSQFLVTVTPGAGASAPSPGAAAPSASNSAASRTATPTASPSPTMLGMRPLPGATPVAHVTTPQPVNTNPVSEGDAYWAGQPAAVQALRDMPEGDTKDKLALKLANQGYAIDTQIMVWGWDPQMTMTVRQNQGYTWVPGYGQSNIPVGPGVSDPNIPYFYNPSSPPAGSIKVSTAFATGTIQNPLVQTNPVLT